MTDTSPPITHQEQVIENKLIDCGLAPKTFTVKYKDYLQSIEIVIRQNSGASKRIFLCVNQAAGNEIVTFEDRLLQLAYSDFTTELNRPKMVADTTLTLKNLNILYGFPKRASFDSLREYARAIETHCGFIPGSILKLNGDGVVFDPSTDIDIKTFSERYSKIIAAVMYAIAIGDIKNLSFIGNEATEHNK